MKLLKRFSYLYDLIFLIKNKQRLPLKQICLCGSRKSGKTLQILLFIFYLMVLKEVKVRIYCFRKHANHIFQYLQEDWENVLNSFEVYKYFGVNLTHKRYKYDKSLLSFHSLYSHSVKVKLAGLSGAHFFDYVIVFIDEIYEFDKKEIDEIKEGIRGAKHLIFIYACNPWNIAHFYIKDIHTILPFNLNELKQKHYQLAKTKDTLYHYSNLFDNELLAESDLYLAQETIMKSPNRALVSVYGYFGIVEGAVYSHAINKISPIIDIDIYFFSGGLDFGYRNDATALIIIATNYEYIKINVIGEYYHNNSFQTFKDNLRQETEILDYLEELAIKYPKIKQLGIKIYCDTSDYARIETLQKQAIIRKLYFINFYPIKKIQIKFRIGLQLSIMEAYNLNVDKAECINFMNELALVKWKENSLKDEVLDENNDTQDAFHYAFLPWWDKLLSRTNTFLFTKQNYYKKN